MSIELTKLTPEQVMEYWPQIRECIEVSLPPLVRADGESMLRVQESLLLGRLECWIASETHDLTKTLGVATTSFVTDEISQTKNLLIYTATTIASHNQEMWRRCYEIISRYARANGCANIIAYSELPEVIGLVERLGGNSNWRILYFGLGLER